MKFLILFGLAVAMNFANALSPKVEADLKAYDEQLAARNAEFNKELPQPENRDWVIRKLQFMVDCDQFMRRYWDTPSNHGYSAAEMEEFEDEFLPRNNALDEANTSDLKQLLQRYAWFSISDWGAVSDNNAWLIVQHADLDPNFQKEVLRMLEVIYPLGETNPKNYAFLFDRVAASWSDDSKRTLQRYGTQGLCVSAGVWEPIPMEEPAKIDERRSSVGLEPMAEYVSVVSQYCR